MKLLFRIIGWALAAFLIYLKITDFDLFKSWKLPFRQIDIGSGLFIFFIALNTLELILVQFYRKRKEMGRKESDNIIAGIQNIYYLILGGAVLATMLLLLGFDLLTFFTSLSIFAAALAVLSKDYISNIISGMLMAFSDVISIGDVVQIGDNKGKVIDITLSKFILLNDDDDMVILPNNSVFSNQIINYTKREIKKTSIEFEMDLKFLKKIEELEEDLIGSIGNYHHLIRPDSYRLKIVEIKKDFVSMKFQYILNEPDRDMERDIRRVMVRHVVHIIKEHQDNANK